MKVRVVTETQQAEGAPFFHVHLAVCRDLNKARYADDPGWTFEGTREQFQREITERFGQVGYAEGWKVFPCVRDSRGLNVFAEECEMALMDGSR